MSEKYILLGFDLEEFDMPLEYNSPIAFDEQLRYSDEGMENILPILDEQNVVATFFTTANYALHRKSFIQQLAQKHEIASHTFYHTAFKEEDLLQSRLVLEQITGKLVHGLRMPRMRPVSVEAILKAGYLKILTCPSMHDVAHS